MRPPKKENLKAPTSSCEARRDPSRGPQCSPRNMPISLNRVPFGMPRSHVRSSDDFEIPHINKNVGCDSTTTRSLSKKRGINQDFRRNFTQADTTASHQRHNWWANKTAKQAR